MIHLWNWGSHPIVSQTKKETSLDAHAATPRQANPGIGVAGQADRKTVFLYFLPVVKCGNRNPYTWRFW